MKPTAPDVTLDGNGIGELADRVTWPNEDLAISETLKLIRDPNMPPAAADRMIRSLLSVAKTAAFGAGALYGIDRCTAGTEQAFEQMRQVYSTPRGRA